MCCNWTDLQYGWYLREAGEEIAERYFAAVIATLRELAGHPGLGRERKFRSGTGAWHT